MEIRGIIADKRDGRALTTEQIRWSIARYLDNTVSDAEMAALLMAIYVRGMEDRETADLTLAMADSGERLDLSSIPGIKVDKHSTGGVGDKTTLIVAPLVASFGVPVPKLSGRALGHTGGTIDKLECIPGLTTNLSPDRFREQVASIGLAIAAQGAELAPADKRLYPLRDRIAAVESLPLIASSVMSKKLAAGADAIVLDVKAGTGAFMRNVAQARKLAALMVKIGAQAGKRMAALVTRMDQPLGRAVGDAVELAEAVETLRGGGPADLVYLCAALAGQMLHLGGAARDGKQGTALARKALREGRGLAKLQELVTAQGGDPAALEALPALVEPKQTLLVSAAAYGYVVSLDARRIGEALRMLKDAAGVQASVCGIWLERKVGEEITTGGTLAKAIAPDDVAPEDLRLAAEAVQGAFSIADIRPRRQRLVAGIIPVLWDRDFSYAGPERR